MKKNIRKSDVKNMISRIINNDDEKNYKEKVIGWIEDFSEQIKREDYDMIEFYFLDHCFEQNKARTTALYEIIYMFMLRVKGMSKLEDVCKFVGDNMGLGFTTIQKVCHSWYYIADFKDRIYYDDNFGMNYIEIK